MPALARLKPVLEPKLPKPLTWADVEPAIEMIDSVEELRAAVEAHRFAEGRWPARLGELASRGYVPDDALTDAKGRPYYYAAREDGFVLLAPER